MFQYPMHRYKSQMLDTLKGLVAIPSVKGKAELNMPYGKEVFRALMFMLDTAEKLDLESVNLFGHMGYASYGTGQKKLVILAHLDVVPAGEGWDTPPFELTEKDGRLFGRGVVDNKGAAVAALYALYALKENCVTLDKEVQVLFGCDEETSWKDIDFYKANYAEPDYVITPDSSFPIINREKGVLHVGLVSPICGSGIIRNIYAGTRPNIVPNKAACTVSLPFEEVKAKLAAFTCSIDAKFSLIDAGDEVQISTKGKSAHGAHPDLGVNALNALLEFLNTLSLKDGGIDAFVKSVHRLVGMGFTGKELGIEACDELSGALSLNLGSMCASKERMDAQLDIRAPISADLDEIFDKIERVFLKRNIAAEKRHELKAHHVKEDSEIVTMLKKVYEECFNEKAECLYSSGATYARAFQNAVAFGPAAHGKNCREHEPNEFMDIEDIIKLSEVLASAMLEIAAKPEKPSF